MSNINTPTKWSQIVGPFHFYLGLFLFKTGVAGWHPWMHEKTMRQLQRASDAGIEDALLMFGQLLRYKGATVYNKTAGIRYLESVANTGRAEGQFMLAEAIVDPNLISQKSPENAVTLYHRAAEQGHLMAALRLSKIYHNGLYGQPVDESKAEHWRNQFLSSSGLEVES